MLSPTLRYDRNRFGRGVLIYILDDILRKELSEHNFPADIEGIFIAINLRKTKWLILRAYHPLSQSINYFFENLGIRLSIFTVKNMINFFYGVT